MTSSDAHLNIPYSWYSNELILADKPVGGSSFDVIRFLKRGLSSKGGKKPKLGHTGTLDPMASGLMLIGVGAGTKKLQEYTGLDKVYYADILVGQTTATLDTEGAVTESLAVEQLKEEEVEDVVDTLVGTHALPVPLYSAVKIDGKPLYSYAREGKEPPYIPTKEMVVYEISLLDLYQRDTDYVVRVRLHVGSGTYIRSIAQHIGKRLGYPAMLTGLRRTRVGEFSVEQIKG